MHLTSNQAMAAFLLLGALATLLSAIQMRSQFLLSETVQQRSRIKSHKGARSIGPHSTVVRSPAAPFTFPLTSMVPSTVSLLPGTLPTQTKASPVEPVVCLAVAVMSLAVSLAWFSWRPRAPEMALVAMAAEQPSNPAEGRKKKKNQKIDKAAKDAKTGSASAGDVQVEDVSAEDPIKANAIKKVEEKIEAVAKEIEAVEKEIKAVENDIRKIGTKIASYESVIISSKEGQPINKDEFPELPLYLNEKGQININQLMDEKKQLRDEKNKLMDEKKQLRDKEKQLRDEKKQLMDEKVLLVGKQGPKFAERKDCQEYMEEVLKADVDEKLNFLPISRVYGIANNVVELTAFDGEPTHLVLRNFYPSLNKEILSAVSDKNVDYVYISGTPGVGKTMFRNYMVWALLQQFKSRKQALRIVMAKGGSPAADLLCLEANGTYRALRYLNILLLEGILTRQGWVKADNLFCLADVSRGNITGIDAFSGCAIIFTSPNENAWKEEEKQRSKFFWMPLWTICELLRIGRNAEKVKERFRKYGGVPRLVWGTENTIEIHERRLNKVPTLESVAASHGDLSFVPSDVQHRFIYLDVHKEGARKYDFTKNPSLIVGTMHLAHRMADHYIRYHLAALSAEFPPKMAVELRRTLFEAIAVRFLSIYPDRCAFHIKCLERSTSGAKKGSDQDWVMSQLTTNKSTEKGFYYCRPPKAEWVEFDGPRDMMETVLKNLAQHKAICAVPRSSQFPGYDAILAWVGTLNLKTSEQSGYKTGNGNQPEPTTSVEEASNSSPSGNRSPGASSASSNSSLGQLVPQSAQKYAVLLQATTTKSHSMSPTGACLLHQFASQGFNVVILYVVPEGMSSAFGKQGLKKPKDTPEEFQSTFEDTPQYCMYLAPGQPQDRPN